VTAAEAPAGKVELLVGQALPPANPVTAAEAPAGKVEVELNLFRAVRPTAISVEL
jgi:hypothetical protein